MSMSLLSLFGIFTNIIQVFTVSISDDSPHKEVSKAWNMWFVVITPIQHNICAKQHKNQHILAVLKYLLL